MKYKKLGNTDINISSIGFGSMGIGGYLEPDTSNDEKCKRAIEKAIDCGINFFDTAESYGNGHAEELIGSIPQHKKDKIVIATKVSPEHLSSNDVIKSAEESLKRLRIDCIDLYQIHWPNYKIPIGETMWTMGKLIREGKIKHVGVSNFSFKEFVKARNNFEYDIVSMQLEYNLFERGVEEEILSYCDKNDITLIAYSPLDQGQFYGNNKEKIIFEKYIDKYDITSVQLILNWLTHNDSVVAIPASTNISHIEDNSRASDFDMSEKDFSDIGRVFKKEKIYVYPEKIRVDDGGRGNRKVYKTVEEAVANDMKFAPSPVELSERIKEDKKCNPVKVSPIDDPTGFYDYELIEGRVRYWAWVIAFDWKEPILVNVRKK